LLCALSLLETCYFQPGLSRPKVEFGTGLLVDRIIIILNYFSHSKRINTDQRLVFTAFEH